MSQPRLTLIVAVDKNGLIGNGDELPWRLPADLRHFRNNTVGKPIIMGRRTFDSIGRPLPDRENIVLTRSSEFRPQGCTVFGSLEQSLEHCENSEEVMVIGGATVYEQALPVADRLILTRIDHAFEGDTWFPKVDWEQWHEVSCEAHQPDEKNAYAYRFFDYRRTAST